MVCEWCMYMCVYMFVRESVSMCMLSMYAEVRGRSCVLVFTLHLETRFLVIYCIVHQTSEPAHRFQGILPVSTSCFHCGHSGITTTCTTSAFLTCFLDIPNFSPHARMASTLSTGPSPQHHFYIDLWWCHLFLALFLTLVFVLFLMPSVNVSATH